MHVRRIRLRVWAPVLLAGAGLVLTGPVGPDGTFRTGTQRVEVGPDTHALSAVGELDGDHLSAEVSAEVTGGQTCRYTVSWEGERK